MFNREIELAMQQNPNLTVRQFANQVGMKVRTFYRRWLEEHTPKELLEAKRLEIAKRHLLFNCNKKISDIARELHFCDHYYFSKWFRRKMGVSPQKYRMLSLKERVFIERKKK
jgi:transcriptional regulator GlxA family with amidase domain